MAAFELVYTQRSLVNADATLPGTASPLVNGQVRWSSLSNSQTLFLRVVAEDLWLLLVIRDLKNPKALALLFLKGLLFMSIYVCMWVRVCMQVLMETGRGC